MIKRIVCSLLVVICLVFFYHQKKNQFEKGDIVLVPVFDVQQGHKFFSDYIQFSYQLIMPIDAVQLRGGFIVVNLDTRKIAQFDSVYDSQKSLLYYQNLLKYRIAKIDGKTSILFGSTKFYVKKTINPSDVYYAVLKVRKKQPSLLIGVADMNGVTLN
ncbi:MAG: hypothetical protein MJ250_04795 [Alphaproteobacteria bacterium]|nr:hypothetical protein [Alphaproteobacteria bacterium]